MASRRDRNWLERVMEREREPVRRQQTGATRTIDAAHADITIAASGPWQTNGCNCAQEPTRAAHRQRGCIRGQGPSVAIGGHVGVRGPIRRYRLIRECIAGICIVCSLVCVFASILLSPSPGLVGPECRSANWSIVEPVPLWGLLVRFKGSVPLSVVSL